MATKVQESLQNLKEKLPEPLSTLEITMVCNIHLNVSRFGGDDNWNPPVSSTGELGSDAGLKDPVTQSNVDQ